MSLELSPTPVLPEPNGLKDHESPKAKRVITINGLPGEAFSDKKTSWTGEIPVVAVPENETDEAAAEPTDSKEDEITPGYYLRQVEEARAQREEAEAAKGESLAVRTRRAIGSAATRLADLVRPYEGRHEMTRAEKKAGRNADAAEAVDTESPLKKAINAELPGQKLPFSDKLTVESHFDMDKKAEKKFNGVKRGDTLSYDGQEWNVQFVDQDGVILRREAEDGVYEEQLTFEELKSGKQEHGSDQELLPGDSVKALGEIWTLVRLNDKRATLRRITDTGEIEVMENILRTSLEGPVDAPITGTETEDDTQDEDATVAERTSRLKRVATKIGDIPRSAAAKLAVRNQARQDHWESLSRGERRSYRQARKMGAATLALAGIGAGVVINSYLSSKGLTSGGGHGSASAADMLMNRGQSGKAPNISIGQFDLNTPDRSSRGNIPNPVEFSKAAQHIEAGEGLNQTFREMGIPREKWAATLRKAGPELVKMGVAYKDRAVGGYGFSQEGQLSRSAMRVISKAAQSIK